MSYFDTSLNTAPVAERNADPVLPEERFIFELIGFERSGPDQYHKNGGVKWTFSTYDMDGRPWEFNDEHYELWRTTNVNKAGEPLFTIGTQAHEWAEALLGRKLGADDHVNVSELRNKRMSSHIVWLPKKTKPTEKSATLASLRHVPVGAVASPTTAQRPEPGQVSADATDDEIDRALLVTKLEKQVARLVKLDADAGARAEAAVAKFDLDTVGTDALEALLNRVQKSIAAVLED